MQFHHLIRTVPASGRVVVNAADPALERVLARGLWSSRTDFDSPQGWHAAELAETGDASEFTVLLGERRVGRCRLPLAGAHNRSNALAAIAAAEHAGVAPEQAIEALGRFGGVARRLEVRGTVDGVTVIDDFAHHPTAIATTIDGLRARIGRSRILAVLEPRSNTMKLGAMKALLPASLSGADRVFCYSGGIGWDVDEALAPLGERLRVESDLDALVGAIVAESRGDDRILVMSNGGFGGIHAKLLNALGRRARGDR
jgi:UDP-N-acetylmuramate: L-alanyl-gamma-D-glutamyl-meso-diaminopimelate ligase